MKFLFQITDVSKIQRISFRQDINGLRAIAVLSVVFYHAEFILFKGGWLGVDIFFVISGYLISNIIISELNEGTFTFKNFYLKRVKRILPALISTLFFSIPISLFLLSPKALSEFVSSTVSSLFFYANYYFMNLDFYIAESTKLMPLLHMWSLAIEEQYYLLFPIFACLVYKYSQKYFGFVVGIFILSSLYLNTLSQSTDKFYRLEFRIWELLLGVLVMILSSNLKIRHLEKIGLPALIFSIIYFDDSWINDTEPKIIALTGIALIIFSNTNSTYLTKVFSLKIISIIGLISYSIYLFHQPLFAFVRIYKLSIWQNYLDDTTSLSIENKLIMLVVLFIFSYLNYIFVETKYINSNKFLLSNLTIFVFIAISLFTIQFSNFIKTDSYLDEVSNIDKNTLSLNGEICHNRNLNNLCKFDNGSMTNVIALGDSSLRSITYWLARESKINSYNLQSITGSMCLFLYDVKIGTTACPSFNYKELQLYVEKITNSIIIISGRLPLYISEQQFNNSFVTEQVEISTDNSVDVKNEFKNTISKLISQDNKIILIYPIPEQGWNVPFLFSFEEFNLGDTISYPSNIWEERKEETFNFLDSIKHENIFRVYPDKIFCNSIVKNQCVGAFNSKIFYTDDDHLSLDGARLITPEIVKLINNTKNKQQ